MNRSVWIILISLFLVTVGGCQSNLNEGVASESLTDLTSIEDLKKVFEDDSGEIRLLLILSPT